MRKSLVLVLLFSVFLIASSCQKTIPSVSLPQTKQESLPQTTDALQLTKEATAETFSSLTQDATSSVPEDIQKKRLEKSPNADGKYIINYSSLAYDILDCFLTSDQQKMFIEMFGNSANMNYGVLVDYYQIPKEEFAKVVENSHAKSARILGYKTVEEYRRDMTVSLEHFYDIWYSDHYFDHEWFVHPDYVAESDALGIERRWEFCRYEPDIVHTDLYYTIDYRLIQAVGTGFDAYKEEFYGTENFNVLHFLDYFNIDKENYLQLFPERLKPHNPDYLYGSKEMQDEYFCRHPLDK